jgi:2-methylisocitrate lyase-like PEP mutase family enzyme
MSMENADHMDGMLEDEIGRLRKADEWHRMTIAERDAEIERLQAALRDVRAICRSTPYRPDNTIDRALERIDACAEMHS